MADGESILIGFKRHLRAAEVPGEAVYLTSIRGTTAVSGSQIEVLAPLLDGTRSLAEVQLEASARMPAPQITRMLGDLAAANLIGCRRPAGPDTDEAAEAYWDLAGLDADRALTTLETLPVRLVAIGGVDAEPAAAALAAAGLRLVGDETAGADDALTMVLCHDYLDPELARINADHLADGRPWLLANPTGADLWVGPVFRPGTGACWACLAARLRARGRGENWLPAEAGPAAGVPDAALPLTRQIGLHLAALETAKWLAGWRDDRQSTLWTLDTLTLASAGHPVHRRPQCAACGDPQTVPEQVRRPIELASRPKTSTDGNGHRAMPASEVWERYRHLADPLTGITDPIRPETRGPSFVHAYLAGPNRAVGAASMSAARAGLRQQSGGKGRTAEEARVGALCEAVERYCGSRLGDEPTVRASYRQLGARAVHPDRCQLFDPRQYAGRADWNAREMPFQFVPEQFDDGAELDWTPTWSLTHRQSRMLPTDLLYYSAAGHPALRANSNGNAAGASLEDAILQGALELVERDAVALWWYNRTRCPEVDLDSFDDPWITGLRAQYASIGREFWVLDVTSDFGIPVLVAISRRIDKPAEDIMLGFGAHFDPHVAARRAITELGQMLPAVADARADGTGYGETAESILDWCRQATVAGQPYLAPDPHRSPLDRASYDYVPRADLRADVDHLVERAAELDLEVLVLDQTRPDIGLPVAKVIIPGMRHFWARFAPGRLFDVPVRLGRQAVPTGYADLNPIPIFL